MTEPNWPSVNDVTEVMVPPGMLIPEQIVKTAIIAIEKCRAAWLVANDEPSKSPIGEVRRDPDDPKRFAQRLIWNVNGNDPWLITRRDGGGCYWAANTYVIGWPVIGAVPGSPAAKPPEVSE